MTIPPKCEDLYLKIAELERRESDLMEKIARAGRVSFTFFEERDAALAREAALREELDLLKPTDAAQRDRTERDALKQRLTVAEDELQTFKNVYVAATGREAGLRGVLMVAEQRNSALEQALKFYADGDHLLLADADAWDTCSGEPINFLHDEAGTASVEDGSIAKAALKPAAEGEWS